MSQEYRFRVKVRPYIRPIRINELSIAYSQLQKKVAQELADLGFNVYKISNRDWRTIYIKSSTASTETLLFLMPKVLTVQLMEENERV
jgi:hypothetical protein